LKRWQLALVSGRITPDEVDRVLGIDRLPERVGRADGVSTT